MERSVSVVASEGWGLLRWVAFSSQLCLFICLRLPLNFHLFKANPAIAHIPRKHHNVNILIAEGERETERDTHRQTGRQTVQRQTDRQTDRDTERERERENQQRNNHSTIQKNPAPEYEVRRSPIG